MKKIYNLSVLLAISFIAGGCNTERLSALAKYTAPAVPNYVTVDARFCTTPSYPRQQKVKYLFVVDHSIYNTIGTYKSDTLSQSWAGDDSDGRYRYQYVNNFMQNLVLDSSITATFSIVDFNDSVSKVTPFQSKYDFANTISTEWSGIVGSDAGSRNYLSAFSTIFSVLSSDLDAESKIQTVPPYSVSYVLLFITDGRPVSVALSTMLQNGLPGQNISQLNPYVSFANSTVKSNIAALLALKSNPAYVGFVNNISVNTAYYYNFHSGNYDVNNATFLQDMATAGGGQYFDFSQGNGLISQYLTPPIVNLSFAVSDAFIQNENITWVKGDLQTDTDGDGVPDSLESSLGSNSALKDSDGNGVSDLVEYRTKNLPCNDAKCSQTGRDAYFYCDGYNPQSLSGGGVQFSSSSNDGLNDCEKHVLGADPTQFNNAGDFVPDYVSFRNNLPFLPGSSASLADPFADGITNYAKIKLGLPTQVSQSQVQVKNYLTRSVTMEHMDVSTPDSDCYHLVTTNVATVGPANKIKLYVVQNNKFLNNFPTLEVASQVVTANANSSTVVTFSPGDFQ